MRCARRHAAIWMAVTLLLWAAAASLRAQAIEPQATATAFPPGYSGADIYELACATCHGSDGRGSPRSVVGFDLDLPDFTDCTFATPEPLGDWFAVIHEGGPVRGLDRHMPAFGAVGRRYRGGHPASLDVLRQRGVAARRPAAHVLYREGISRK